MTGRPPLPPDLVDPAPTRLSPAHPRRVEVLEAHRQAIEGRRPGYLDPASGLWVWTAAYLWERGHCCDSGCRHCPYTER